ncbi:hypothetical protein [Arthrobacter sp. NA-172]|uniref:hypothetical protein n=1 Tax=Arthrobacter sp. NA-172 TaxID=3367524 RepID=UPI003753ED5D
MVSQFTDLIATAGSDDSLKTRKGFCEPPVARCFRRFDIHHVLLLLVSSLFFGGPPAGAGAS